GISESLKKPTGDRMFISQAEVDAMENIMKKFLEGKITGIQCDYNMFLCGHWKRMRYYKSTREQLIRASRYTWDPAPGFEKLMLPEIEKINLKGKFDNFKTPTLIIENQWDFSWRDPNGDKIIRKNHPRAQVEVFKEAGHLIFADQPKKFFTFLRDFLKKSSKINVAYKPENKLS
ncbi:unnamed protein product, partial [marine sediment metagenome]